MIKEIHLKKDLNLVLTSRPFQISLFDRSLYYLDLELLLERLSLVNTAYFPRVVHLFVHHIIIIRVLIRKSNIFYMNPLILNSYKGQQLQSNNKISFIILKI